MELTFSSFSLLFFPFSFYPLILFISSFFPSFFFPYFLFIFLKIHIKENPWRYNVFSLLDTEDFQYLWSLFSIPCFLSIKPYANICLLLYLIHTNVYLYIDVYVKCRACYLSCLVLPGPALLLHIINQTLSSDSMVSCFLSSCLLNGL